VYGLLCLAAVVAWLLRDPVWNRRCGAEEVEP